MRGRASWLGLLSLGAIACGSPPSTTRSVEPTPLRTQCTVTLRFEDHDPLPPEGSEPVDPAAIALPHTRVTLVRICEPGGTETRIVGEELGICQFADPGDALLRARCWWAGNGSELQVFRVLRSIVVRRAELREDTGLGPFSDAVELDLPVGARLNVLGPETLPHHP